MAARSNSPPFPAAASAFKKQQEEEERDRNRHLLKTLYGDHKNLKEQFQELKNTLQMLQPQGISDAEKQELQTIKQENQKLQQEMHSIKQDNQKLHQEVQKLKNMLNEDQQTKALGKEMKEQQRKIQENQQNIEKLKQGIQSKDELTSLRSKADLTELEFRDLKKQIYDRGLLAPVRTEPVEEENPPVGTMALGEDVFTARLLLRLGFMKARHEASAEDENRRDPRQLRDTGGVDEFEQELTWEDSDFDMSMFANVTGISLPEIDEDSTGYFAVTTGWLLICVGTLLLQLLILFVMIKNGMEEPDCLKKPMTPFVSFNWWLLHMSKGLGLLVAGALMGRDIMDTINYQMVSELLEPRFTPEVYITSISRILLNGIILAATFYIFLGLTNPADCWLNMTALGFIASMGSDMLDVAKRGVFGHHIGKAITGVNFELTFLSEYPGWFKYVRGMALLITVCAIGVLAFLVFIEPDPPLCHPLDDSTLARIHKHLPNAAANVNGGDTNVKKPR